MNFPEFTISLGGNLFIFIVVFVVVVAGTIFFYRTTIPSIRPRKKFFLALLRGLALTIVALLIFEPLLKFVFRNEQEPVLAMLIDCSESMTIRDRTSDRSTLIRQFLENDPFAPVPARISYYQFASQLNHTEPFQVDSLRFNGETTDLATALSQLKELRAKENIRAVVLISDGIYTVGRNPLAVVDDLPFPVYTIGAGDTMDQLDVLIAKVTTNNIVYAETRVPVDVRVRSSGFKGEKVEVTLAHGTTILDRKILQLQEGTRDYSVSLFHEPKDEGVQKYTVSVSSLPGELTEKNNARSFFVKVLKTKLHVLLIAGAPSQDVSIVRQTIAEEQHFSVKTMIQKKAGEFYEGSPPPAMLDSADCLVFLGFPSAASSPSHLQFISDVIERTKKPILFIASRTLDFEKLRTFESVLPFSWSAPNTQEILMFPEVPEKQHLHVLVQLEETVTLESWQQLPPIFKTQTVFHAKPEADVLAFALPLPVRQAGDRGQAGKIQSVVLNEPLVVLRNVAGLKSFAITGHGIWRWRLLAQGNPQTERFLSLLLTNSIRWLTTTDEGKNVRVVPTKEAFTTAESIEFTGEVYDEQLRPLDNAELRVEVSSRDQKTETILRSIGNGRYEGSIEGLAAGDYTFSAKATFDGNILGEDKGKFSVGQMNVEFIETKMNKQLLEQLAFRTGGLYADIAQAATLIDSLRNRTHFTSKEIVHTREIELWNWQYLTGLLILLLATEWFVRKKSGML